MNDRDAQGIRADARAAGGGERRVATATLNVVRAAVSATTPAAEIRADGSPESTPAAPAPARIVGHASVFNEWTTLHDSPNFRWREVIRPGAFRRAIKEGQDVRALFNHDSNFILGRTKSGTLQLRENGEHGLEADMIPPDTQTVRDLVLVPMERGDLDGMSFSFGVKRAVPGDVKRTEDREGNVFIDAGGERIKRFFDGDTLVEEREVIDADLFDVSPVTFPAYGGTDVSIRAVGPEIERRAREMDRPHRRPAPRRDRYRRWLDAGGSVPTAAGS